MKNALPEEEREGVAWVWGGWRRTRDGVGGLVGGGGGGSSTECVSLY